MTSQTGQQTITLHVLPNISRSKGNHTIKFGQLIECSMSNIFPEKSCTNCCGQTSPRPFFKKSKLSISLSYQQSEASYSLFLLYVQVDNYQKILKLRCQPVPTLSYKAFLKIKKRSGTSFLASFSG